MKIKAISIHQPWASMIANGQKSIETRGYATHYRGELLICSTKKPFYDLHLPLGKALCIVKLYDCKPMLISHEKQACCKVYAGAWSWFLRNIRRIEPFEVKGKQGFYEVELPEEVQSQIVNSQ